ncbi:hypothetical protein HK414_22485 [Ramlibacter terrae]|uniref:Helix-turn-helix domain-containing protein n=1 Tax=Ramlibacter terrae TaxID=2732511 RepID=A0ABX6P766_9BURK|nr:hypothetical protein HK414_22485 [Ramlibacter terrae]
MSERTRSGDGISPNSLPNAVSALVQFMQERGYRDDECVGTHFRVGYYRAISHHVTELQKEKRPGAYIRNRKALLKQWRALVMQLDRSAAAQNASETPFQSALRALFAGVAIKTTALRTGVPLATIKRWMAGGLPQRTTLRHVQRPEHHFGQVPAH